VSGEDKGTDTSLSSKELRKLYVKTDNDCRDINGKLLDLEQRASHFEKLVEADSKEQKEAKAS
jgi:hypothetical protein